jgi:hypothetical protein
LNPWRTHYPGEYPNLLLYQLKQKEEVKRVEKEIADRIEIQHRSALTMC